MPLLALLTLLALLPTGCAKSSRDTLFVTDPEAPAPASVEPGAPWREAATELPPWPRDDDLIEFGPDGADAAFRYFIDGRHLAIGQDGVVRYTLVIESRGGTRNLSFEGLRCTPQGQYRVYAYGVASGLSGRFEALPGSDWERVAQLSTEPVRRDLWASRLCAPGTFQPRPRQDMLRALQGPINPRQNTGFLPD